MEWVDHISDRAGRHYTNQGVHVLLLKWGKLVGLHIYCDTALLSSLLQTIGDQGVGEAVAAPIGKLAPFADQPR